MGESVTYEGVGGYFFDPARAFGRAPGETIYRYNPYLDSLSAAVAEPAGAPGPATGSRPAVDRRQDSDTGEP